MKKITTFFAVAALVAFALIFAATNYPNSPPAMAEQVQTVAESLENPAAAESFQMFDFNEYPEIQTVKRLPFDYAETGDIPISVFRNSRKTELGVNSARRTDSANTRRVYLTFTDEPPTENPKFIFATQIYEAPNLGFRGFGFDALSRSKI